MNRGELIREARDGAGMTQADLAERVGLDPSMISKLEAGKVFIEPDVHNKLCDALRGLSR